jgi:hypothetical protein
MIRALQRVPGVLLAEVDTADARAVVAHDAGVRANALIVAAQNVGVQVRIVGDTRVLKLAGSAASPVHWFASRQLLIAAAAAFIVLTVVDLLVPNAAQKHGILIVVTVALWTVFLAKSFMVRR